MLRGNRYQRKRLWKYKKKGRKADGTASLASLCCLDEIRGATFDASFTLQFISGTSANTIRAALETDLESYHFAQPLLITFLTLSIAIAFQLTSHFHTWLPKVITSTLAVFSGDTEDRVQYFAWKSSWSYSVRDPKIQRKLKRSPGLKVTKLVTYRAESSPERGMFCLVRIHAYVCVFLFYCTNI